MNSSLVLNQSVFKEEHSDSLLCILGQLGQRQPQQKTNGLLRLQ